MSVICLATVASGILVSKGLLYFDLAAPMFRYGTAVLFSYAVFFALIYFWLHLHFGRRRAAPHKSDLEPLEDLDLLDLPTGGLDSGGTWNRRGGESSGARASSSWASGKEGVGSSAKEPTGLDTALDSADFDEAAVIVLLIAVFAAVFGSAGYLVYSAPEILFEAGFEVVLAAGLLRRAKKLESEGWHYSIFKRTWWLFALVLVASMAFGFVIRRQCPAASSFAQYRELCWGQDKR